LEGAKVIKKSTLLTACLVSALISIGCAKSRRAINPEPTARAACERVGEVAKSSNGTKGAAILVLEEDHLSRVGQIQHAITLVRLHNQHGLRHIALEGYLKERPEITTDWFGHADSSQGPAATERRNQVAVRLLKEGEINSAEFLKIVYDDVQLHPIETISQYAVDLDENASRAPTLYLVRISQQSLKPDQNERVQQLKQESEALTGEEKQKKTSEMLDYIISRNAWTEAKATLLRPDASRDLSVEKVLALMEEIEKRARELSVQFAPNEKDAMERNLNFWRMRIAAGETMVRAAGEIADRKDVSLVVMNIGAAHTEGVVAKLTAAKRPLAVVTPMALKNHEERGDLTEEMLARKYKGLSAYSEGFSEIFQQTFPLRAKMPEPGLLSPAIQAKSEAYFKIGEIVKAVLGGAPPPSASGGTPPWGFSDDYFRGKWIYIDPHRIEKTVDPEDGNPQVVFLPLILNPDDPTKRKEIWVKAAPGTAEVVTTERRDVEGMLIKVLEEAEKPPGKAVEDKGGRVQITLDTVAAFASTREGAKKVALKA
jgi:hypothetical protein